MTDVGRSRWSVFQRFKTGWRISLRRAKLGLTNKARPGEVSRGGRFHPIIPTESFSCLEGKPIGCWLAEGLPNPGDVAARRTVAAPKRSMCNRSDHYPLTEVQPENHQPARPRRAL